MRFAPLARDRFAAQDFQAGFQRELAQFVDGETEIAVIERRHRRAMRVLRQCRREQMPAGLQRARRLGDRFDRLIAVCEGVHQQNQIEAAIADIERMHVAGADFDVLARFQPRLRGGDHALARVQTQNRFGMRRQQFGQRAVAGRHIEHVAAVEQTGQRARQRFPRAAGE